MSRTFSMKKGSSAAMRPYCEGLKQPMNGRFGNTRFVLEKLSDSVQRPAVVTGESGHLY